MEVRRGPIIPQTPDVVRAFGFVVDNLVTTKLILEGCRGDETLPQYGMAQEGLATIRDSMRRWRVSDEDFATIDREADRIILEMKAQEEAEV